MRTSVDIRNALRLQKIVTVVIQPCGKTNNPAGRVFISQATDRSIFILLIGLRQNHYNQDNFICIVFHDIEGKVGAFEPCNNLKAPFLQ